MPICYPKLFIHTFSKKVLYSIKQLIYTSERPASKLADLPGLPSRTTLLYRNFYKLLPHYATFRFVRNTVKPTPRATSIIAAPTPTVRDIPVINHNGVKPTKASFQDINVEYTP